MIAKYFYIYLIDIIKVISVAKLDKKKLSQLCYRYYFNYIN